METSSKKSERLQHRRMRAKTCGAKGTGCRMVACSSQEYQPGVSNHLIDCFSGQLLADKVRCLGRSLGNSSNARCKAKEHWSRCTRMQPLSKGTDDDVIFYNQEYDKAQADSFPSHFHNNSQVNKSQDEYNH